MNNKALVESSAGIALPVMIIAENDPDPRSRPARRQRAPLMSLQRSKRTQCQSRTLRRKGKLRKFWTRYKYTQAQQTCARRRSRSRHRTKTGTRDRKSDLGGLSRKELSAQRRREQNRAPRGRSYPTTIRPKARIDQVGQELVATAPLVEGGGSR